MPAGDDNVDHRPITQDGLSGAIGRTCVEEFVAVKQAMKIQVACSGRRANEPTSISTTNEATDWGKRNHFVQIVSKDGV